MKEIKKTTCTTWIKSKKKCFNIFIFYIFNQVNFIFVVLNFTHETDELNSIDIHLVEQKTVLFCCSSEI